MTLLETIRNAHRSIWTSRLADVTFEATLAFRTTVYALRPGSTDRVWGQVIVSPDLSQAIVAGRDIATDMLRRMPYLQQACVDVVALCTRCSGTGHDRPVGAPCSKCDTTGVTGQAAREYVTRS